MTIVFKNDTVLCKVIKKFINIQKEGCSIKGK